MTSSTISRELPHRHKCAGSSRVERACELRYSERLAGTSNGVRHLLLGSVRLSSREPQPSHWR